MSVQITVRYTGKSLTLYANPDDTIRDVKCKMHDKTGIAPEVQNFESDNARYHGRYDHLILSQAYKPLKDKLSLRMVINHKAVEEKRIKEVFKHEPNTNNCPSMGSESKNNSQSQGCDAYQRLKNYKFSENDLEHMQCYSHCGIKPVICRHSDSCNAYQRLMKGGNRLDDRCHLQIYAHPPRVQRREKKLGKGFHSFVFDKYKNFNTIADKIHKAQNSSGYVLFSEFLLIEEVKHNGFGSDLIMDDGKSLLTVVDSKLKHERHKAMGSPLTRVQMLALVMYTGCDCNYDLCASERNGDYRKWVVFGYVLDSAIIKLRDAEYGKFPLYSGVGGCMFKFDDNSVNGKTFNGLSRKSGMLVTFTSTSWDKSTAELFMGDVGMIIGMESSVRQYGCDVSWISKFSGEKEILFTRGLNSPCTYFSFIRLEQSKTLQKVVVVVGNAGQLSETLF